MLKEAARQLNVPMFEAADRVQTLQADASRLEQQLKERAQSGTLSGQDLLTKATTVGDVSVVVSEVPGANANLMRQLIDQIRKSTSSSAVMLFAAAGEGKVTIVAGISKSLTERGLKAGDWVKEPAQLVGGSGGGRPDLAQAGGKDAAQIPAAIQKAEQLAQSLFA